MAYISFFDVVSDVFTQWTLDALKDQKEVLTMENAPSHMIARFTDRQYIMSQLNDADGNPIVHGRAFTSEMSGFLAAVDDYIRGLECLQIEIGVMARQAAAILNQSNDPLAEGVVSADEATLAAATDLRERINVMRSRMKWLTGRHCSDVVAHEQKARASHALKNLIKSVRSASLALGSADPYNQGVARANDDEEVRGRRNLVGDADRLFHDGALLTNAPDGDAAAGTVEDGHGKLTFKSASLAVVSIADFFVNPSYCALTLETIYSEWTDSDGADVVIPALPRGTIGAQSAIEFSIDGANWYPMRYKSARVVGSTFEAQPGSTLSVRYTGNAAFTVRLAAERLERGGRSLVGDLIGSGVLYNEQLSDVAANAAKKLEIAEEYADYRSTFPGVINIFALQSVRLNALLAPGQNGFTANTIFELNTWYSSVPLPANKSKYRGEYEKFVRTIDRLTTLASSDYLFAASQNGQRLV